MFNELLPLQMVFFLWEVGVSCPRLPIVIIRPSSLGMRSQSLAQPHVQPGTYFPLSMQPTLSPSTQGFGDPAGEHWLGNEVVHQLSSSANYSLRVEMEDWQGNTFYANFGYFQLDSEKQFYRLARGPVGGWAGSQESACAVSWGEVEMPLGWAGNPAPF